MAIRDTSSGSPTLDDHVIRLADLANQTITASIAITESQVSDLQNYEPAFTKNTGFNLALGSAAGTVAEGNDARLSDARAPTAHAHVKANITDFSDGDYATSAQGAKADSALQSFTEANNLALSVAWANVPDANITASSVTQHTAAVVTTIAVTNSGALMDSEVDVDLKTLALPANTTISAFGATLVDDASNTAARATLGVSIGSQVQAYNVALTGTTGTYTSANAAKLSGIATAATANSTNAVLLARANHTGTQTLATISDVPANPIAAKSIWSGTQAAYDALTPDANTMYLIEA